MLHTTIQVMHRSNYQDTPNIAVFSHENELSASHVEIGSVHPIFNITQTCGYGHILHIGLKGFHPVRSLSPMLLPQFCFPDK